MQFSDFAFSWKETSYACVRKLGEGGASTVNLMMATSGSFKGKLFAVKFFKKIDRPDWQLSFMKEIHFLRSCSHPAIIRVFDEGVYQDKFPFVVMEHMQGSLADRYKIGPQLSHLQKVSIVVQILSALNYLSRLDPPGVHRDIKPQNILMRGHSCVLSDFGLVFLLHTTEKPKDWEMPEAIPMARMYRTPELIPFARDGTPLPPASDVFQLGLVAAELFTGTNPLRPTGGMKEIELNPLAEISGRHAETVIALLKDMLILPTADRITAAEALDRWQKLFLNSLEPAADKPRKPR
jgi:serine/threonine-protein kinase